jgi:hypothetical protein
MSFLIACDIDHTLLNDKGDLLEINAQALHRAQAQGATVILVTARSYAGAKPIHEALGLETPLIVSSGTLVCDKAGEVLHAHTIATTTATGIVELFLRTPHHWSFRTPEAAFVHPDFDKSRPPFNDDRHYRRSSASDLEAALNGYSSLITASLYGLGLTPFFERNGWSSMALRGDYYPPSHYNSLECVNLMSADASKGRAVAWLRRYMGLEQAPTLCLGDSAVDATMFPLGIGVAPANAAPEVQAAAAWVAPHCDEGAVAAALERFVFTKHQQIKLQKV